MLLLPVRLLARYWSGDGPNVADGLSVELGPLVALGLSVGDGDSLGDGDGVGVGLSDGDGLGEGEDVGGGLGDGEGIGEALGDGAAVGNGDAVSAMDGVDHTGGAHDHSEDDADGTTITAEGGTPIEGAGFGDRAVVELGASVGAGRGDEVSGESRCGNGEALLGRVASTKATAPVVTSAPAATRAS